MECGVDNDSDLFSQQPYFTYLAGDTKWRAAASASRRGLKGWRNSANYTEKASAAQRATTKQRTNGEDGLSARVEKPLSSQ